MKKDYEKPIVEVVKFELLTNIMSGNTNLDDPVTGSTGFEFED